MNSNFRLLDLFCGAGGASVGYDRVGFKVTGVDIHPQPNYPFDFIQEDVLKLNASFLALFDAIHASPPCQSYSTLAKLNGKADTYPRLIDPVRQLLKKSGKPWVIENVVGAPLRDPIVLCGTMFPPLRVIRHRLFETSFPIPQPFHVSHKEHPLCHTLDKRKKHYGKTCEWSDFVQVMGGGNCSVASAQDAMGINWMKKKELNEAIPPAYAEFVGEYIRKHLQVVQYECQRTNPQLFALAGG